MQVNEVVYYTSTVLTEELKKKIKSELINRMKTDDFVSTSPINIHLEVGGFRVMGEFKTTKKSEV